MKQRVIILSLCCATACAGATHVPLAGWRVAHDMSAEAMFARALDDLDSGLYPEALKGFADVKTRYPYSSLAPLSDLRVGDTHFRRAKFAEAVDAYRNFLKLHPSHSEGPYALLQIGAAYFEQIPGDWWLLPPSSEKDQASTRRAITAYEDMLARYPDSALRPLAHDKLKMCQRRLADHEIYVARFYFDREHYAAAAARAEFILDAYQGVGLDAEALWVAAQSHARSGDTPRAHAAAARLVSEHPSAKQAAAARALLTTLPKGAAEGAAAAASTAAPATTPSDSRREPTLPDDDDESSPGAAD